MKVLVTGCAGFIGSHLIDQLVTENCDVIGIDNLSNGSIENMAKAKESGCFQFVKHDLRLPLDHFSFPAIDAIVHLAAIGSVPRSLLEPMTYVENNVMGFQNVLDFARKKVVKTLFFASSSSVYGDSAKFYRSETDTTRPKSPYAGTKLMNELMADVHSRAYGLDCHALRFFNVYGPRQKSESEYAAVIPKFVNGILGPKELTIFGDGKQQRTFTPVEFVAEVICRMLSIREKITNSVINVTSVDYAISVGELANLLIRLCGAEEVKINHAPERAGDIKSSIGYGKLLNDIFGESVSVDYPQLASLQSTCDWYKAKLAQQ